MTPNPGSDEALEQGCTCAVLDNGHGRGIGGDGNRYGFLVSSNCPIHGLGTNWFRKGNTDDETHTL